MNEKSSSVLVALAKLKSLQAVSSHSGFAQVVDEWKVSGGKQHLAFTSPPCGHLNYVVRKLDDYRGIFAKENISSFAKDGIPSGFTCKEEVNSVFIVKDDADALLYLLSVAQLQCDTTDVRKKTSSRDAAEPNLPKVDVAVADAERLKLLDEAASTQADVRDPIHGMAIAIHAATIELLGGESLLGRTIRSDEDLVEALANGFPGQVLRKLQEAGCPHLILEQVVAPRRTLMRRRGEGKRLTSEESDATWRLAHAIALAERVLDGRSAALSWLTRPRERSDRTFIELLNTSVGAAYVERKLWQLEWGDVS